MTATSNNAAASNNTENSASKGAKPVFYTLDTAAVKVALWKNTRSTKDNAPVLTGKIGDKTVAGFLRQGPNSKFIGFSGEKLEDGTYEDLGTANVVAGNKGYPALVIKHNGQEIWANTTKEGDNEFLASLGLDIDLMLKKQAEAKDGAANADDAKEAA